MKLDKERSLVLAFVLLLLLNIAATVTVLDRDGDTTVETEALSSTPLREERSGSAGENALAAPASDPAGGPTVPAAGASAVPGPPGPNQAQAAASAPAANRQAAPQAAAARTQPAAAGPRSGGPGAPGQSGAGTPAAPAPAPAAPGAQRVGVGTGVIKVGALSAGNFPIPYGDFQYGLAAYFRHINDQGGIHGMKIQFVSRDANFDSARGTTECRRLIEQDKVFALVGSTPIFGAGGCYKLANEAGVPNIGPDGVDLEGYRYPNTFNLSIDVYNAGRGGAYWAYKKGARECSVIYVAGNQSMTDYKDGFVGQFEAMGGKVVSVEAEPIDQPDFSATILRIRSQNPDCLFLGHAPDAALRILQAMQRQGDYSVPYLVFGYENYDERVTKFAAQYPTQVKNAFMPVQLYIPEQAGQYPVVNEYVQMMKKYYPNAALSVWQQMAWLSAKAFVEALRNAGPNPTRSSVMAALESLDNFDTGMFPDTITKKQPGVRHLPRRSLLLLKYDPTNARWVPQPEPPSSEFWVPALPRD